jgi:hypothetical protein
VGTPVLKAPGIASAVEFTMEEEPDDMKTAGSVILDGSKTGKK